MAFVGHPTDSTPNALARTGIARHDAHMILRQATPADAAAVRLVHSRAFAREAGAPVVEALLWDRLVELGADVPVLTFVAAVEGQVVGHVGVSEAEIDGRPVVAIGPVGVLPSHQRRGVGSALVHAVIGAAEATRRRVLILLGSPDYYARFGFQPAQPLGIEPPVTAWGEHFQVLPLTAYDPALVGTFSYAAPFRELDPASAAT
jgi:putative acetyltransferase